MYFGAKGRKPSGMMTVAQRQAAFRKNCRNQGLVFDKDLASCRPKKAPGKKPAVPKKAPAKRGRKPSGMMTVAQRQAGFRANCKKQGLVYDRKIASCRPKKTGGRKPKAAFGLMYSTPGDWGHSRYYQASKFNTPDLLLGKAFQTVANRAAAKAVAQEAAKVVAKQATKPVATKKMSFK